MTMRQHIHTTSERGQPPLITHDFCHVAAANFFLFFSFYALMPLLPFYLSEQFAANGSVAGLVLSSYMAACIVVRPFVGYLLDTFRRRPVYLLAYFCFAILFCGYAVATALALFVVICMAHGLAFGAATVSGTTLVSQIIPHSRLGEGLGIYGLANTLSMCLGPMLGLAAYGRFSFDTIFVGITVIACCGLLLASLVKIPAREQKPQRKITLSSFFISSGWWASLTQLLVFIPYGATSAYIAVYAKELGIGNYGGLYFTLMAIGLAVSRPIAGKKVDKGMITRLLGFGLTMASVTYFLLSYVGNITGTGRVAIFLIIGLMQGFTYGLLHPSFNTLFVKLAPQSRRGAATSMFLTSNDIGIGIGMLIGSIVAAQYGGFYFMYRLGAVLSLLSLLLFLLKTKSHYLKNKIS